MYSSGILRILTVFIMYTTFNITKYICSRLKGNNEIKPFNAILDFSLLTIFICIISTCLLTHYFIPCTIAILVDNVPIIVEILVSISKF